MKKLSCFILIQILLLSYTIASDSTNEPKNSLDESRPLTLVDLEINKMREKINYHIQKGDSSNEELRTSYNEIQETTLNLLHGILENLLSQIDEKTDFNSIDAIFNDLRKTHHFAVHCFCPPSKREKKHIPVLEFYPIAEKALIALKSFNNSFFLKLLEEDETRYKMLGYSDPDLLLDIEHKLSQSRALPFKFINLDKSIVVRQGEGELLDANDNRFDYLVSRPFDPCVGLYTHNSKLNIHGLLHVDDSITKQTLTHFFEQSGSFTTQDPVCVKIIDYPDTCDWESWHSPEGFSKAIQKDQVSLALAEILESDIFPRISHVHHIPQWKPNNNVKEPEGYPEVMTLSNPTISLNEQDILNENIISPDSEQIYFNYLVPLTILFGQLGGKTDEEIEYVNSHQLTREDLTRRERYPSYFPGTFNTYAYCPASRKSFGVDTNGQFFSTNYALSARAYGLPSTTRQRFSCIWGATRYYHIYNPLSIFSNFAGLIRK